MLILCWQWSAAAHDQGVIHRELKSENIFDTHNGQLKILDFGLAKLRHTRAPSDILDGVTLDTGAGRVLGTAGYMSLEQVRGEQADQRSDIFSFGSILYEMLCGQRAFQRKTSAETMRLLETEPMLWRRFFPSTGAYFNPCNLLTSSSIPKYSHLCSAIGTFPFSHT